MTSCHQEPVKTLACASRKMLAHRSTSPRGTIIENLAVESINVLSHQSKEPIEVFISSFGKPMRHNLRRFGFDQLPDFAAQLFTFRRFSEKISVSGQLKFVSKIVY